MTAVRITADFELARLNCDLKEPQSSNCRVFNRFQPGFDRCLKCPEIWQVGAISDCGIEPLRSGEAVSHSAGAEIALTRTRILKECCDQILSKSLADQQMWTGRIRRSELGRLTNGPLSDHSGGTKKMQALSA